MRTWLVALPFILSSLTAHAVEGEPAQKSKANAFGSNKGYLATTALPDSASLLPQPPVPGSAAQSRDEAEAQHALTLRGTSRWEQAIRDADLRAPTEQFECALGIKVSKTDTPHLARLLNRSMIDFAYSSMAAKRKYQRPRPFMVNGAPICTPDFEKVLRLDGSFPSGHSAYGWGTALILAEIAPERANDLLVRGRAYGQSRVICNVHWLSDTEEGRVIASATFARLHSQKDFQSDLKAARKEIAKARNTGAHPSESQCANERAALAAQ